MRPIEASGHHEIFEMSESISYVFYGVAAESSALSVWAPIATAAFSLFVAVWALIFSARQLKITDLNHKLMTTPHLDGLTATYNSRNEYSYSLRNTGIGPAVLVDVNISLSGNRLNSSEPLTDAINLLFPEMKGMGFAIHTNHVGDYILPGDVCKLITITNHPSLRPHDILNIIKKDITIVISYRSIYCEDFIFSSSPNI